MVLVSECLLPLHTFRTRRMHSTGSFYAKSSKTFSLAKRNSFEVEKSNLRCAPLTTHCLALFRQGLSKTRVRELWNISFRSRKGPFLPWCIFAAISLQADPGQQVVEHKAREVFHKSGASSVAIFSTSLVNSPHSQFTIDCMADRSLQDHHSTKDSRTPPWRGDVLIYWIKYTKFDRWL